MILKYPYPKLRVSPNSLFSKVLFPLIDRLPRGRKPKKSWRTEMRFARRWSFKGGGPWRTNMLWQKLYVHFCWQSWSQTASMLSAKTCVGCIRCVEMRRVVSLEKRGWLRIGAKLNPVDSSVKWSATGLQVLAGPTSQEYLQTKHQQLSLPKRNIVPR